MSRLIKDIKEETLDLSLNKSEVITIILDKDLTINYDLNDGEYKFLIFNNSSSDLTFKEKGSIKNSDVTINFLELNNNNLIHNEEIEVYRGSHLTVNTTYLGVNNKKVDFNLINKERDSSVDISNNVVCFNDADFTMNVVGKIVNGAINSKCHQKSRCLTFESPKQSKILPVLLIDENDVEASHSLSSGTIDEDVLFYMNSRGLNKKEALSLLLYSYLMPNEEFYKEYEALDLKEIADKKVNDICSM